jgi:predicted RNase H-like nuclease (RuvC/YqgF family)
MAKAEPDLAEVNRLIRGDIVPAPNTVSKTIEHALAVLRSENAWLKDCAKTNAEREAQNEETRKKNIEGWRRENLRLQEQLLASQERVYELQAKLLSLREIVNGA